MATLYGHCSGVLPLTLRQCNRTPSTALPAIKRLHGDLRLIVENFLADEKIFLTERFTRMYIVSGKAARLGGEG
jgi:hypothetical protein